MTTWTPTEQTELERGGRLDILHDGHAGDPVIEWGADVDAPEVAAWKAGDVYGWMLLDDDGDIVDSCWGYYGGPDSPTWAFMVGEGRDAWQRELELRDQRAGVAPSSELEGELLELVRQRAGDDDSDGEVMAELRDCVNDYIGGYGITTMEPVADLIDYRALLVRLRRKVAGKDG